MQILETHLLHVVLISFLPTTTQEMRDDVSDRYTMLGQEAGGTDAGILFWSTKPNMDLRKNIHLIEVAIFKDSQSYEKFKNHPKHKEVVELLKTSADWSVGDTIESFPRFN